MSSPRVTEVIVEKDGFKYLIKDMTTQNQRGIITFIPVCYGKKGHFKNKGLLLVIIQKSASGTNKNSLVKTPSKKI